MPADTFDPFAEWLGIPAAEQPPNHYRLLGLATFESDVEKIERAVDERMTIVRRHQTGPRAAATQRVLNRLAAAKQCLINPGTRDAYDAAIRGQLAACRPSAASAKRPRLVEQPPEFEVDVPPVDATIDFGFDATSNADRVTARENAGASEPRGSRRRSLRPIVLLSVALTLVTLSV